MGNPQSRNLTRARVEPRIDQFAGAYPCQPSLFTHRHFRLPGHVIA